MIPFAICGAQLHIRNEAKESFEKLEIRLLEMSPYFCTFRLPVSYREKVAEIEGVEMRFSLKAGREKLFLGKDEFWLEQNILSKYCFVVKLSTDNKTYKDLASRLSYEYMDYIEARLTMDDAELSHHMTGTYPPDQDDDFASCYEEQMEIFKKYIRKNYDETTWRHFNQPAKPATEQAIIIAADQASENTIMGITLESHSDYKKAIQNGFEEVFNDRCSLYGLDSIKHPFATMPVKAVAIGNPYCPLQLPTIEELNKILTMAFRENLEVILKIPPVSELRVKETINYLTAIKELLKTNTVELEINDQGIQAWLEEQDFGCFQVRAGILLNKAKRDARVDDWGQTPNVNISPQNVDAQGLSPYLPWFQMNTGTFCPLYAKITTGDRGKSIRVTECPGYCENHVFLYPKHLKMLGRFNSVFGADLDSFCDGNRLPKDLKRIFL